MANELELMQVRFEKEEKIKEYGIKTDQKDMKEPQTQKEQENQKMEYRMYQQQEEYYQKEKWEKFLLFIQAT